MVAFRVEDVFGVEVVVDKISALVVVTTDVGNVGFDIVCVSTDIGEWVVVDGIVMMTVVSMVVITVVSGVVVVVADVLIEVVWAVVAGDILVVFVWGELAVEKVADGVVLLEGIVVGAVMFRRFESVVENKP